jgi:hypothetical protein
MELALICPTSGVCRMSMFVEFGLYLTAAYAFICGGRFTYGIYELMIGVMTVLCAWHVLPSMASAEKEKS